MIDWRLRHAPRTGCASNLIGGSRLRRRRAETAYVLENLLAKGGGGDQLDGAAEKAVIMAIHQPSRPKVLLIPEGSLYLAFRLPRLFCQAGWAVDILCLAGDPVASSRHVSSVFQEKCWADLVARLQQFLRAPQRPWQAIIVVPEGIVRQLVATGDPEILQSWQPAALQSPAQDFFLSKLAFETVYQRGQLKVPPSRVCSTQVDILEFGRHAGWPIIVKPADESGGAGVVKYDSPEALALNPAAPARPLLAQKFIPGRRGVVDMLCSAGRPLAWLASYSSRQSSGAFSPSTARLFSAMPELQPLVEGVARYSGFEGFCGFDWIEEAATGTHYLIEFHPRPPSGFRFGKDCGVDFPAAITAWLRRETAAFPPQTQPPGRTVAAHYFSSDLFRCFRQRDWPGLKAWLPGSGACHDFIWDDLPLLLAWSRQSGGRRLRKWFATSPGSGA